VKEFVQGACTARFASASDMTVVQEIPGMLIAQSAVGPIEEPSIHYNDSNCLQLTHWKVT